MNVFGAISEAFHDLIECFSAICGEEVSPMHRREIIKSDEGVETSFALGQNGVNVVEINGTMFPASVVCFSHN